MSKQYRPCAGIVLFNKHGKVLLCARNDQLTDEFQFPQGGIEKDELPQTAALRELKEETSVISAEIVDALNETLCYDFPPEIKQKFSKNRFPFDGQEMHWFLLFFKGEDSEINLQTKIPEFRSYKWADITEAKECIFSFKKEIYQKVCDAFAPKILSYIQKTGK